MSNFVLVFSKTVHSMFKKINSRCLITGLKKYFFFRVASRPNFKGFFGVYLCRAIMCSYTKTILKLVNKIIKNENFIISIS